MEELNGLPILDGYQDIWDIDTEEEDLEYFEEVGVETFFKSYYDEYLNWWKMVSSESGLELDVSY